MSVVSPLAATLVVSVSIGCSSKRITPEAAAVPERDDKLTPAQQVVALAGDPQAPADLRRDALLTITNSTAAGEPVYLDFYRATLADPATDPTVATAAAAALALHGDPTDAQRITPLLDHEEDFARWQAATSLQRLHDPAAIPALIRVAADDRDADTRMAAAHALGQYPRRDVFDALVLALDDRDYGVSRTARESLTLLTGHDAGEDPRAWLDHANDNPATLFANPGAYTYLPYPPRRGLLGYILFWTKPAAQPQPPIGYDPRRAEQAPDAL